MSKLSELRRHTAANSESFRTAAAQRAPSYDPDDEYIRAPQAEQPKLWRPPADWRPDKRPWSAGELLERILPERRSPVLFAGTATALVAVSAVMYFVLHAPKYPEISRALESADASLIEPMLPRLRALSPEERTKIFLNNAARSGLITYFEQRVNTVADPKRGRNDFQQAEKLLAELQSFLPESQVVHAMTDQLTARRRAANNPATAELADARAQDARFVRELLEELASTPKNAADTRSSGAQLNTAPASPQAQAQAPAQTQSPLQAQTQARPVPAAQASASMPAAAEKPVGNTRVASVNAPTSTTAAPVRRPAGGLTAGSPIAVGASPLTANAAATGSVAPSPAAANAVAAGAPKTRKRTQRPRIESSPAVIVQNEPSQTVNVQAQSLENQDPAAQIETLKQQLLTQAQANQADAALGTLLQLRTRLPVKDPFVTKTAPQEVGEAYLRLASAAVKEGQIGEALTLAERGHEVAPAFRELDAARERFTRYQEIDHLLKQRDSDWGFPYHMRYKISRVSKLAPEEMQAVNQRWARDLADRINSTQDPNAASRLSRFAQSIFPDAAPFQAGGDKSVVDAGSATAAPISVQN